MRSPLGNRYLSAPIAQRLARSLRMREVPGSNPTVGMHFQFVIVRCAPHRSSKPIQNKSTMKYPILDEGSLEKNIAVVSRGI